MKIIDKAILPSGFLAAGIYAGIKKSPRQDLALFFSEHPCRVACMFTTNSIKAAPIKVNHRQLKKSKLFRALIANSGNANCFTGTQGIKDAQATIDYLAHCLKIKPSEVLVASTGVIGKRLAVDKIIKAVPSLLRYLSTEAVEDAADAIMTTDKLKKQATVKFKAGNKTITVCGLAKGAGMISPRMATMLAFIFTDINIGQKDLDSVLKEAVSESFNSITVDGCMSTNDTVILMANGAAGNCALSFAEIKNFKEALKAVCLHLAKLMVRDGEGASKFIRIQIDNAKNFHEAQKAALAIANSNLFKTAIYGENRNFGRIAAAVGASGVKVKEECLKFYVSSLEKKEIDVKVSLGVGKSSAVIYTSDLTPEYIKINAEYN